MKVNTYTFKMTPVPKPRMVRSDKWKKRPAVERYWAFKDQLKMFANIQGLYTLPASIYSIRFNLAMPESWSKAKKERTDGFPHQQTPDLDNMLKSLADCLCKQDNYIFEITNGLSKFWAKEASIVIRVVQNPQAS